MADANPQQQFPLPPSVDQLIDKIRTEQSQPPLEAGARRLLASLTEEYALKILDTIYNDKIYKSFDGFIFCFAKQSSPNKRLCVSTNSGHPSPHQYRSPAPPPTPVFAPVSPHAPPPTRLFMSPSTAPFSGDGGSPSRNRTVISAQMKALTELEFRKVFLILSYLGGMLIGTRRTHIYHCYVSSDGSYKFKGPFLTKLRNCLQKVLGDSNVLMVKFSEEVNGERSSGSNGCNYYDEYKKVLWEGIPVALHRYRFLIAVNRGEMDDDFMAARMILSGNSLQESCLQYCLSHLAKEEKKALQGGEIHVPESYYLMGTVDPTGLLKSNEVCIILSWKSTNLVTLGKVHTVGEAAHSWQGQAMMDRLFILGETEETNEIKKNTSRLINIYYDALDAPKKGGIKMEVPRHLKPDLFPRYMERSELKSYQSTILGKNYNKVKEFEQLDRSPSGKLVKLRRTNNDRW